MLGAFLIHVGSAQEAIMKKGILSLTRNFTNLMRNKALRSISKKSSYHNWMELPVKLELLENPEKNPTRLRLKPVQRAQPYTPT
jgi:hypothetical protein